jgi:hypothetical protein
MPVEVVNPEHLIAFGVTSRSQAARVARHHLRADVSDLRSDVPLFVFESRLWQTPIEILQSYEGSFSPELAASDCGEDVHFYDTEVRMFGDDRIYRASELDRASGLRTGLGIESMHQNRLNFDRDPSEELRSCLGEEVERMARREIDRDPESRESARNPLAVINTGFANGAPFSIANMRKIHQKFRQLAKEQEDNRWATDPLELMLILPRFNSLVGRAIRDFAASLDSIGRWLENDNG